MKTRRNIFIAFILNLCFAIFELMGGFFTNSVAIISDSVHDFGDAISIGTSFFLEVKSYKKPNKKYTYGYARFSVLGGFITTMILLISSGVIIYNAIVRIINPAPINYNGVIILAVVGLVVNLIASCFTHGGKSINQRAVNLHMIEDVFGWVVVLVGAIIMRFTNFYLIDPILSIALALFIIFNSLNNLRKIISIFLIKTPKEINVDEVVNHIKSIDGIIDVHHFHVWSIDGEYNCATLHVVSERLDLNVKKKIREELGMHGISHSTIEFESSLDECEEKTCMIRKTERHSCHYHH